MTQETISPIISHHDLPWNVYNNHNAYGHCVYWGLALYRAYPDTEFVAVKTGKVGAK